MSEVPQPCLSLSAADLGALQAAGLGSLGQRLQQQMLSAQEHLSQARQEISWRDAKIDKLSFEIAQLRRLKFGQLSERMSAEQRALFDEEVDTDIAELEAELQELVAASAQPRAVTPGPKRQALPAHLPRVEHHHEPESTTCGCGCTLKRVGQDVSEKLDYQPGVFTVERHIRGQWACAHCRTLTQAPVPAQIIDKGVPTAGLLAQVLVAKYADHLPLYRQQAIFGRAGLEIARSTLAAWVGQCGQQLRALVQALQAELLTAQVLHADETPVATLAPGTGKTQRSYLWAYLSGPYEPIQAVVYDFASGRSGQHTRDFLGDWRGSLVCDDYAGYKALFAAGVTEVGCMAHARRKFVELHQANKSSLAATAIDFIGQLYVIEREIKAASPALSPPERLQRRQSLAAPVAQALHDWLIAQRTKVPDGTASARAMDYSLNRWAALTRYLGDAALPIDNNLDEQQIRPWATGRKNWLFAGTLKAGQRAAAIMSLIQSAKLNGHDPYAYLKDVLTRLPIHKAKDIAQLLPHHWQPAS
jgi:transposase